MGNPFGRNVVLALTNQSGGSVAAGDFVYLDTAHNDSFTTGTTSAYSGAIGVAQQAIGSGNVGLVLIQGYASLVNVNASVTRGHYGYGYTVAKQATDAGTSRITGTCMQFLTGGTTPDAVVWQPDLGGTALTNPMNAEGDVIYGGSSGTPTRLAVGTAGYALISNGTDPAWSDFGGTYFPIYGFDNPTPTSSTGTFVYNVAWTDMGTAGPWGGYGWYNSSSAQNDQLTWTLFIARGTYAIKVRGRKSSNLGILTIKVDGSSVGTIDFYNATPAYLASALTGISVSTGGSHTVQIIVATKNASSSNYLINLLDLIVYRTA